MKQRTWLAILVFLPSFIAFTAVAKLVGITPAGLTLLAGILAAIIVFFALEPLDQIADTLEGVALGHTDGAALPEEGSSDLQRIAVATNSSSTYSCQ